MKIDLNEVMDAELNSSSLAKKFKIYFNKRVGNFMQMLWTLFSL